VLGVLVAVAGPACTDKTSSEVTPLPMPSMIDLEKDFATLRAAHVYFNHQSVGGNILSGVERLGQVPVKKVDGTDPSAFAAPGIVHSTLGDNGAPASKIAGFKEALLKMATPPDVAMMKFCYVDFDGGTDPAVLFAEYRKTLDELAARFPTTRFMHLTVPLLASKPAWKMKVKELLGRPDDLFTNEKREAFSQLVRSTYPAERVFDLARYESTRPDGTSESFRHDGKRVPALVPAYSDDGAHLGPLGQERVARAFLHQVAAVARVSGP
jgi:hypothetical protein